MNNLAVIAGGRRDGGALPSVPGLKLWLVCNRGHTVVGERYGAGEAIAGTNPQTLTDSDGAFTSDESGMRLATEGASQPANNGEFSVTGQTSSTLTLANFGPGVAEPSFTGRWRLGGRFTSLVDRVAALPFTQGTTLSQPAASIFAAPGMRVIGKSRLVQPGFLAYSNTPFAGQFQGVNVCMTARLKLEFAATVASPTICTIDDGTTTNRISFFFFTTGTTARITWQATGTTQLDATIPAPPVGTWFTAGFQLNFAARTCSYYQDGVLVATSAAGTARNPVGFTRVSFGQLTSSSASGFFAGYGLANAAWTAADFLAAHNAFRSYSLP